MINSRMGTARAMLIHFRAFLINDVYTLVAMNVLKRFSCKYRYFFVKVYGFSGIIYAGFLQRGGGKSPLPPTEEGDMDEG